MSLTRRHLLAGAAAAFGQSAVPGNGHGRMARPALSPGLQLYTLNKEALSDLDATLRAARQIGFRHVELAGLLGRSAAQLRSSLDRADLRCTSIHLPSQSSGLSLSDDPGMLAEQLRVLGCKAAVLPTFLMASDATPRLPGESGFAYVRRAGLTMRKEDWQRNAAFLNRIGPGLKREGIALGYHNHNPEFAPLSDGRTGFDVLLAETDPATVHFELDVGWSAAAGVDAIALMRQYPGRIRQMHLKDTKSGTPPNFTYQQEPRSLGDGQTDWPRLLRAAVDHGVNDFFVEQEPPYPVDALTAIARSYRYLRNRCDLVR